MPGARKIEISAVLSAEPAHMRHHLAEKQQPDRRLNGSREKLGRIMAVLGRGSGSRRHDRWSLRLRPEQLRLQWRNHLARGPRPSICRAGCCCACSCIECKLPALGDLKATLRLLRQSKGEGAGSQTDARSRREGDDRARDRLKSEALLVREWNGRLGG